MSLYHPMDQAEEPDEEPRPPMCINCYGVTRCAFGCPGYEPPWSALDDEDDEPAPVSAGSDDIDF